MLQANVFVPAIPTPFSMPGVQMAGTEAIEATRVLVLLNMVTKEELVNDDDYAGITIATVLVFILTIDIRYCRRRARGVL